MRIIHSFVLILSIVFFITCEILGQWNPTNGPYGGKINCVASTGKRLLAGTNSGLFYSSSSFVNISVEHRLYIID